ncbi:MAG: hypothetical protein JW736_04860, partial [Deltaproteobacteria bacterium]|nr:hypothetical protein [Deltaproteobacteria bacterium]
MNQENNRHQYQPGYTNYRDDEINLIDYLRVLWKWKVFIALVVALCVLVVGSIMFIKYPTRYVTTCTVSLSFPGIEKHENPDGTVFTKEQLITPVLLNRLYDLLHQDIENIK